MSASEVADNEWESSAAKPPLLTMASPGGFYGSVALATLMGLIALVFLYIIVMSVVAIVSPKQEGGWAKTYENLNAAPAEEATPAE